MNKALGSWSVRYIQLNGWNVMTTSAVSAANWQEINHILPELTSNFPCHLKFKLPHQIPLFND